MAKLTRDSLYNLEQYSDVRPDFRRQVIDHKKHRQVRLGENATLYFEDELTIKYQIQEMLRIEKIFEATGIEEELHAYNPLIPDGANWKATFMLEYADPAERKMALSKLAGIEDKVWIKINDFERVYAIADEDLERSNEEKTSAVHFVRFELTTAMIDAVKSGGVVAMGIDHENYFHEVRQLEANIVNSLIADLH